MNTATISKLAATALATGVVSVALAAPASAMRVAPNPGDGGTASASTTSSTQVDQGWQLTQVATGAAGGIALVGAGAVVMVVLRRHGRHAAHPA